MVGKRKRTTMSEFEMLFAFATISIRGTDHHANWDSKENLHIKYPMKN
jgi:hypothetical protein